MYKEIIEKYYVFIAIILFFVSYLVWWPYNWMITDSMSYSSQALAFADGRFQYVVQDFLTGQTTNLIKSPYSLGTASYLSIFVFVFGKHGIFAGSLLSVIASALLLAKTTTRNRYPSFAIVLLFLSIPMLFFSRSLMSCMPSLLVISIFVYYFFREKYLWKDWFILGLSAGLSAWFRETNALLLAPFCLYLIYENRRSLVPLFTGGIIGLGVKFVSSYIVYGKFWFVSASSGFSLDHFFAHSLLYLFITIGLIPLGLIMVFLSETKASIALKLAIFIFIVTYILYNYSAVSFSGFAKGSLLTSRFMIPMIPIMVIAFGEVISRNNIVEKLVMYIAIPLSLILIPASQYAFSHLYSAHESAAKEISQIVNDDPLLYDQSGYTNIIRYMNPLTINLNQTSDIQNFKNENMDRIPAHTKIVVSMSTGNDEKIKRTKEIQNIVTKQNVNLMKKIDIDSENWLEVYELND